MNEHKYSVKFNPLDAFLNFILFDNDLMNRVKNLKEEEFEQNICGVDGIHRYLLYRDDEYQVQIFQIPKNYIGPEHTHPNFDSYEVHLSGRIAFTHSGYWIHPGNKNIKHINNFLCVCVKSEDLHGAITDNLRGEINDNKKVRFMSVQRWLNGVKPNCATKDYTGQALSQQQVDEIIFGNSYYLDDRTPKCSATLDDHKPHFYGPF